MKYRINLITKKETNILDEIVYFFLNYLRYIFVFTQLIIITVFFYRFRIDQEIIDLKESIDQKQEIVQVVSPLIQEVAKIDQRTKEVRKILFQQRKTEQIFDYLISRFPEKIYLNNLNIEKNSAKMEGVTFDISQLQSFYYLLKKEKKFALVNLSNLKKIDLGYSFTLTLLDYQDS
ncbi:MAG: PilN domain-containing protein [Microgenomates group bacterium]|nr:PilN domain-containing protein [Microgenomates group bacterium]